uniref:YqgE/AlgH family protein n=1 Tax=uncultured Sulfitobacter sp. TaxID=191468 RepID=UPI0025933AEB
LKAIAEGAGPRQPLLALGHAGWGPGQLEGEIAQNAWLVGDAPKKLVFGTPDARKWETALAISKVSPLNPPPTAGHA